MDKSISPSNIRIDKNGVWYYQGAEIIRHDILEMFYENMEKDDTGRYLIQMGAEMCWVEVEDTPWIVKEVDLVHGSEGRPSKFQIRLSDNSVEILQLEHLWVGDEDVLYCTIKEGRFHARFSRPAYYEFSKYIQFDEKRQQYFVAMNGKEYGIQLRS